MKIDNIGFTGTRGKITHIQESILENIILNHLEEGITKVSRDGMCIGADAIFADICRENGYYTMGYPGVKLGNPLRDTLPRDIVYEEAPFLTRNMLIVKSSDFMICIPNTQKEVLRSGTWSTIRYAKKLNKLGVIIYPNGELEEL